MVVVVVCLSGMHRFKILRNLRKSVS